MRRMRFADFVQGFFQYASVIITVIIAIYALKLIGPTIIPNSIAIWLWMGGKENVFSYLIAFVFGALETIGMPALCALLIIKTYKAIGKGFTWIRTRRIWDQIRHL